MARGFRLSGELALGAMRRGINERCGRGPATPMQENDRVQLVLPWPPTVNHSTAPLPGGGRVLTDEHRAFRRAVAEICHARRVTLLPGRLSVEITLFPPDARKFDIDNRVKAVLDALRGCVFLDDDQVDKLEVQRMATAIAGEGSCGVLVKKLPRPARPPP